MRESNGQLPTQKTHQRLHQWVKDNRKVLLREFVESKGVLSSASRQRVEALEKINVFVLKATQHGRKSKPQRNYAPWKSVVDKLGSRKNAKDEEELEKYISVFTRHVDTYSIWKECKSIHEYVLRHLKVGDIRPTECTKDQPAWNIRHNLSYIVQPEPMPDTVIIPTKAHKVTGLSKCYSYDAFKTEELDTLLERLVDSLPPFMLQMHKREVDLSRDELVEKLSKERHWQDHFIVSVLGTDPSGGSEVLAQSRTKKGPRRLSLSVEINGPKYSKRHKCHVEHLYAYSYSFVPRCWMGLRCMREHRYRAIAEIGVALWRIFRSELDPVSQVCPPTGASVLGYYGLLGGEINPHNDANPRTPTLPENGSQLLGSSVMTLSLFDSQCFQPWKDKKKIDSFITEHGSVYILRMNDDLRYKHSSKFFGRGKERGKIRLSIVYRWLGRRQPAFCSDYKGRRQNCEVWENPNKTVAEKFPHCSQSRDIFNVPKMNVKEGRSLFPAENIVL